jgi:hypothetical protein
MAPLCSSNEGSTHRKCPGVDTRSVRRASGLLETRFSSLDSRMVRVQVLAQGTHPGSIPSLSLTATLNRCLQPM